jgi:hypothetical protein
MDISKCSICLPEMDRVVCNQLCQVQEGDVLTTYCFGAARLHVYNHTEQAFVSLNYEFADGDNKPIDLKKPSLYRKCPAPDPEKDKDSDSDAELQRESSKGESKAKMNIEDL